MVVDVFVGTDVVGSTVVSVVVVVSEVEVTLVAETKRIFVFAEGTIREPTTARTRRRATTTTRLDERMILKEVMVYSVE